VGHFPFSQLVHIREQDPLKQGLKHWESFRELLSGNIREQDPLKQGLKLKSKRVPQKKTDSRARSTKTRIETQTT